MYSRERVLSGRRSSGVSGRDRQWEQSMNASMKMEQRIGIAALDIEKFSKLGTEDLNNGHPERALESFKYAYKRSRELDDGYTERACAFNLGAVYIALGNNKRGLEILDKAVPPDNKREGRSNGDLYFNFGLGYEGMGNEEEAVRYYNKALEEYKVERENVGMEAECLEKISRIYVKTRNNYAVETFSQLITVYDILDKPAKKLDALSEKANQLFLSGKPAEAETCADECFNLMETLKTGPTANFGTIYNDLGLIYTQQQKYDKAASCFEKALPLVRSQDNKQQEAVILQNLGATYNFLGDYQRAVQFHEEAADLYAKLKIRNNQGQCFANLAFAFSQIGDIESAGEAFLHALQAAKDSGDQRTQWQVCEGLGAVAFHQQDIPKAINYFKRALRLLAATENTNNLAQDRIVTKLTQTLEAQVMGKRRRPKSSKAARKGVLLPMTETLVDQQLESSPVAPEKKTVVMEEQQEPERRRFVPVIRRGSMRQHEKVARGLSSMSGTTSSLGQYRKMSAIDSTDESESSKSSDEESSSDSSKESVKEVPQKQTPVSNRNSQRSMVLTKGQGTQGTGLDTESDHSEDEEEEEEASPGRGGDSVDVEEDEDKRAVQEQLKKQLLHSSGDIEEDSVAKQEDSARAGTHNNKQSEDQVESDETSTDDEFTVPDPPTKSPPQTSSYLNTYESPQGVQRSHGQPDSDRSRQRGERSMHARHPNFMNEESDSVDGDEGDDDDDKDDETMVKRQFGTKLEASGVYHNDEIIDSTMQGDNEDDPVYQSINTRQLARSPDREVGKSDESTRSVTPPLPRGVRDAMLAEETNLYLHHQKMAREKQKQKEEEENASAKNKDSKTCSIM